MIDYEKLKLAHELAKKHANERNIKYEVIYSVKDNIGKIECNFENGRNFYGNELSMDILINQLKQLTKPEPKYKVGDIIHSASEYIALKELLPFQHIESFEIMDIEIKEGIILYSGEGMEAPELLCYPTRQALIEHQIEYWRKLQTEDMRDRIFQKHENSFAANTGNCVTSCDNVVTECQHERDINKPPVPTGSKGYVITEWSAPCLKCGELFVELASTECQHNYEPLICLDNSKVFICTKCREYKPQCPHDPDFTYIDADGKCIKCREFYR